MQVLHTADWHLRDKDIDEADKCLTFLIGKAREISPDLIIHAGDVFDSQNVKLDSRAAKMAIVALRALAEIAPVIVVIGTPSHDGMAIEVANHIKAENPIHVSTRPEQLYFIAPDIFTEPPPNDFVDICDAIISTVPAPTKQHYISSEGISQTDQMIGEAMTAMFAGFAAGASKYDAPHILAGHFQVGGAFISESQQLIGRDIEVSRTQIDAANADLVCLGHIHKAQKIGDSIFYPGSLFRLNYGEQDAKGFYIHEVDSVTGLAPDSEFIETPARKLVKHAVDIRNIEPELIADTINYMSDEREGADVKLEIQAWEDEAGTIDIDQVKTDMVAAGASSVEINLIRIPRENVRSERLLHLQSLREKICERAALAREEVGESVLVKADMLEGETQERIFEDLSAA